MQPKHITIRRATVIDLEELLDISNRTYHESFFEEYNDPVAFKAYTGKKFAPELINAELADPDIQFYFAMDGERLVGYTKLNYGNNQTIFQGKEAAEIEHIYVLASYQSQKIGKNLLDDAITTARSKNLKKLWLAVWENNYRAIKFYEQHAFQKFVTHQYLVGNDPQTDVLMELIL